MTAFKPYVTGEDESSFRQWLAYTFAQASTGVAKTGVLAGLGVTAATPSPSGSVVVGKGAAVCQPSSQAFPLVEPADETFDVFTANPMQFVNNPRNDVIVLDQVTGLVKNLVGTPNAVPASGEQTVPNTAVPLARLRHAANATTIPASAIDDLRQPTALFGTDVLVSSTTQRDSLVKYVGLAVYRTDVKRREQWDGTGWLTEVFGMDTVVTTNGNGEFNFDSGLTSILYANVYNGNGGLVRAGNRQNVTIARNSAGASYTGGAITGIIYAADTKAPVASTSARVDWIAKGYS